MKRKVQIDAEALEYLIECAKGDLDDHRSVMDKRTVKATEAAIDLGLWALNQG
jgi:DNA polymerase III delta subunit